MEKSSMRMSGSKMVACFGRSLIADTRHFDVMKSSLTLNLYYNDCHCSNFLILNATFPPGKSWGLEELCSGSESVRVSG
ncbi:hypothetical protein CEXT_498741 [Caerostris extrusa]|uniref:Uncharacterized protein n=1 Tax=Caerostris extrusa TaxID=172846 RepID=A0AAV4NAI6_CAEEX|nr:hypothetical protein CEXT_498741 [Caerostris extrusa]